MRGRRLVGCVALALTLLACGSLALADSTNGGWDGQTPPNNPGYDSGESNLLAACINDEEWFLYSSIPKCTPLATDPQNSAGMFVNSAWKQFTTGRPDVIIGYMEGGPNWHDPSFRTALAPRMYLNEGELPYPELASGASCGRYDCNGDGSFNVFDYAQDPRVHTPYINGSLTPEDLIVAFGDCRIDEHTHLIEFCRAGHHYDNDGDGYPNDISGWNFMAGNNDPATSDGAYRHSDAQMERAAAEANTGVGDVGVCPGCTVLPIKAGAEALDRTDRVAQAIYFALANHVSVLDLLTAELGYSKETAAALNLAWERGMVVIGASNDFDSEDHQEGMFWPHMWPGNGLVPDGQGTIPSLIKTDRLTTEFRSRSNETSFGPHALFSAPNEGGSTSESQPTQAALAALVVSEGFDASDQHLISGPLSAGEVEQVVRATASPIDDPTGDWPGQPGATFNIQYGYGRPDVLAAMQAVAAGRIPPVPSIDSPNWYALYDPVRTTSLPIDVDISARRAASFTWRVQYGLGDQPTESQFVTIASGTSTRRDLSGVLARLNLDQIPQSFWEAPFHFNANIDSSTEQYDVTLRVQATDQNGNVGEDRRVIAVFHDPSVASGFPMYVGDGAPAASPELADLQGSGRLDIIWGDSNGWIHAIDPLTRRELSGWPVHTDPVSFAMARASLAGHDAGAVPRAIYEPILSPAAVGDLYGNGAQEVVVTSTTGRVYVFDRFGREEPGFPKTVGAQHASFPVPPPRADYTRPPSEGAVATPVLWHLPGSTTRLDIIQAAWDGRLYAWDGHGRVIPGWPIDAQLPASDRPTSPFIDVHDYKIVTTPTLTDLFGNGQRELVIKSQEFAYDTGSILGGLGLGSRFYELAFWPDGNRHPGGALVQGFPVEMQGNLGYYGSAQDWITEGGDSPSAAPGRAGDTLGQNLVFGAPQFLTAGGVASQSPKQPNVIALLAGKAALAQPGLFGDRVANTTTAATPVTFTESGTMAPFAGTMAYLTGGLDLDTLAALIHNGIAERIANYMFAFNAATGKLLPGFNSAAMMGLPFLTAPAVADISGDGQADVINNEDSNNVAAFLPSGQPVSGWPKFTGGWTVWTPAVGDLFGNGHVEVVDLTREGYLFVWNTPGKPGGIEAWDWHENNWHTGRYGDITRPPLVPRRMRLTRGRLCWVAPGSAWGDGVAAHYELRAFSGGIAHPTPETFLSGTRLGETPAPSAGGATRCMTIGLVPPGTRWLALRAVNSGGLVSYPAVVGAG